MSSKLFLVVITLLLTQPCFLAAKMPLQSSQLTLPKQAEKAAQAGCFREAYLLLNDYLEQKQAGQLSASLVEQAPLAALDIPPNAIYGLLSMVLLFLWRQASKAEVIAPPAPDESKADTLSSSTRSDFLDQVELVILANLETEAFGVASLSQALYLSRSQLHRKIKAESNITPSAFMKRVRLKEAKRLLEEKVGNISEVAILVGMPNLAYFSRSFKSEFGYPPSRLFQEK
ncbi:MAG: helix-turn-helix transcriptional regulator [Saprospiraceae bacterium]|nr:helix-turn-helix transcriptional regulator [Saprospiraceae bacterium]